MTEPGYVLITGASTGLGRFFAQAFAARKQNLILVARNENRLAALAHKLSAAHEILAEPLALDLAAPAAGQQLAEQLRARKLTVELLVNNAGFGLRGKFWTLPLAQQLAMINLHNAATVELTYQLLPPMLEAQRGGIINVSSLAGFQPIPFAALYSATKAFLTTFSMALREELRPTGVKVVTVCPGRLRADPEMAADGAPRQKVPGGEQGHEEVVKEALHKLDSGGGLVIPGRMNRWLMRGQRLIPPNAVPKIVARMAKS
jgi:short-subunit dehydrogenase